MQIIVGLVLIAAGAVVMVLGLPEETGADDSASTGNVNMLWIVLGACLGIVGILIALGIPWSDAGLPRPT